MPGSIYEYSCYQNNHRVFSILPSSPKEEDERYERLASNGGNLKLVYPTSSNKTTWLLGSLTLAKTNHLFLFFFLFWLKERKERRCV